MIIIQLDNTTGIEKVIAENIDLGLAVSIITALAQASDGKCSFRIVKG
jgi:hypothetical protein